jgi:hypothetical protein
MRSIVITIPRQEILNEVARRAYTLGQVVGAESDYTKWLVQGVSDAGKKDLIDNAILDGWELAMNAMSPYVTDESATGVIITCVLEVADNSRVDIERAIGRHLRRVLEYSALSAWKLLMGLDASVDLSAMSGEAWRLKVILNTRVS